MASSVAGASTSVSALDMMFRRVLVMSRLYTDSWGEPRVLRELLNHRLNVMSQRKAIEMIDAQPRNEMIIQEDKVRNGIQTVEGRFRSPHAIEFPHQMVGPVQWAHWKGFFPTKQKNGLVIHLAGTGDHTYFRREIGFANDLLKDHGIASIMLHNPFYAMRKPPEQFRSSLKNVSDLFVMGAALIAECSYLLKWAKEQGYWPLGISGVSMGGHMASLGVTNAVYPIACVPCLSWTTAAPVYTEGALSVSIPYDVLSAQLDNNTYRRQIEEISNCDWLEEARAMNDQNKKGLAFNFMWVIMTEFTHLRNYPIPLDASLTHNIIAQQDAYVIRRGATPMQDVWPDVTVERLPEIGHVGAYIMGHSRFRKAIINKMSACVKKYPKPVILA